MSTTPMHEVSDAEATQLEVGDLLVPIAGIAGSVGVVAVVGGWTCPFTSIGLACPGCGCTRAVGLIRQEGIAEAIRNQPTATLFLLVLVCALGALLVIRLWSFRRPRLVRSIDRIGLLAVAAAGIANATYQVIV